MKLRGIHRFAWDDSPRDISFTMNNTQELRWALDAAAGNRMAFGCLYDRYVEELYRFIYYKTHHKQTAEDMTSDVFIKALDHIGSFDGTKGSFRTWLYAIARRTVIDYYRTQKIAVSIDDAWDIPVASDMRQVVHAKVDLAQMQKYMQLLSSDQRDVIVLRLWEDMSFKEIAEILEKSEASCKMAFSRSMKTLREAMPATLFVLLLLNHII